MLMQRYHVYWGAIVETPEDFIDENMAWIAGDADAHKARKESGVKPGEEDIRVQAANAGLMMPDKFPSN